MLKVVSSDPKGSLTGAPTVRSNITSIGSLAIKSVLEVSEGATAFKRDYEERAKEFIEEVTVEEEAAPMAALFTDTAAVAAADAKKVEADRRMKAIMQGYTGNMCLECSNFTMVRNGTCEKCDTCGSTSGCS